MRRILIFALTLVAFVALSAPAMAADHTMRIAEFQTGPNQFVELQDSADEPFPNQPYRLVFYDARGTRLDGDNLLRNGLDSTGTSPYTVGTNVPNSDENLSQGKTIPAEGQICLTRGQNEDKIHCVAYGCVTSPLRSGFVAIGGFLDPAPAPTGGQSSQRQSSGRYHLANPTPDAANVAGRREFTCIRNGTAAGEQISGTPFDDLVLARGGSDFIQTFAGNDRIRCGGGRDRVLAGAGRDRIFGGPARDRLRGNSGRDRIRGEGGNDRLFGGSGNDRLSGGRGRDRIFGNSGNDIMSGGPNRDFLAGGPGVDVTTR